MVFVGEKYNFELDSLNFRMKYKMNDIKDDEKFI